MNDSVPSSRSLREIVRPYTPARVRSAYRTVRRAATFLPRRLVGTITRVETREPVVALTFDDGPDPLWTPRYLETLERYGARGTFFVIGESAARYPGLVRRIRDGGHAVGNHSWDHRSFPAITAVERRRQLQQCAAAIGGISPKLFRPPYGNQTWMTRIDALRLGWEVVTWDVCATDWRDDSAETVAARTIEQIRPGSIVLLHDSLYHVERPQYATRAAALRALELILERLPAYRFVTVPDLMRIGRAQRELWYQPGDAAYLARLRSGRASGRFDEV